MLRPMGTTNVNPINGVPFGQEKTREDCLARAAWEYDQASRLRAAQRPVGYQALVEGHERAARAYERLAEERPSASRPTVSPRTPLQEKMRKKSQKGRAHARRARSASSPDDLEIYSKSELDDMPRLSQGQAEDLKVEDEVDGTPTRWWLSRMTREDGETHAIHVEQLIDGRWEMVHKYGRPDASRSHATKRQPASRAAAAAKRMADPLRPRGAHQKWNVYSGGKLITSVFYVPGMEADDVRRGLIDHDGYPSDIKVKRAR